MGEYRYRGVGFDSAARVRGGVRASQRPRGRDSIFPDIDSRSDRLDRQRRWGGGSIHDHQEDRDIFDRAGDEVLSWFGDEDAERRRDADARRWRAEEQERANQPVLGEPIGRDPWHGHDPAGATHHDDDYRRWRDRQIEELDRDYAAYRQQRQQQFDHDFGSFRQSRQTDRLKSDNQQQQQAAPSPVSALGNDGGDASKAVASGQTLGATESAGAKGGSGRSR